VKPVAWKNLFQLRAAIDPSTAARKNGKSQPKIGWKKEDRTLVLGVLSSFFRPL
jgi:hypothetical protein